MRLRGPYRAALPILVVAGLAGCGGGSSADGAATCLKAALNNTSASGCGQTQQSNVSVDVNNLVTSVTCTKQSGNEYVCTANYASTGGVQYDVTYDGKSIEYQQTG